MTIGKLDMENLLSSRAAEATLTDGSQKAIVRGGAKGATTAADVTSKNVDANIQAVHVVLAETATVSVAAGINVIGKVGIDQTTPGTTNAVAVTGGTVAHDAPSTANPLLTGFVAESTTPAAVTDGKLSQDAGTLYGARFVNPVTSAGAQVTGATGAAAPAAAVQIAGRAVNIGVVTQYMSPPMMVGLDSDLQQPPGLDTTGSPMLVGAAVMGLNMTSTYFERLRCGPLADGSVMTGVLDVVSGMRDASTGNLYPNKGRATGADGSANTDPRLLVEAALVATNGTTNDRWRNNTVSTPLASALRTASTSTPVQVNYNATGAVVILEVTAASGTGGLTIRLNEGETGQLKAIGASAPAQITANVFIAVWYPAATATGGSVIHAVGLPVTRDFVVTIEHGDASNYTYSVRVCQIL